MSECRPFLDAVESPVIGGLLKNFITPDGIRRWSTVLISVALLFFTMQRAHAVSVIDLVQDTPAVRKQYRMDLLGFSTETSPVKTADESPGSAEKIWLNRTRYLDFGEIEKADIQTQALIDWRLDHGRSNLVPFAVLLVREAFREADRENTERAEIIVQQAIQMAPNYPPVYLAEGHLALQKSWLGITGYMRARIRALKASIREIYHLVVALGRLGSAAALAVIMLAALWMIPLLVRHSTYIRHDLEEQLRGSRRSHSTLKPRIIFLAVLTTLVIFSSPLWLIVIGILLSWAYQNWRERTISITMVTLIAALPILSWVVSSSILFLGDDLNQALMAFRNGSETPVQATILEEHHQNHPEDLSIPFSLGLHYWRLKSYDQAEKYFKKVWDAGESLKLESTVNLGNIRVARGNLGEAAELYKEAIRIAPDSASAHYNLGQVLNLQFEFKTAQDELQKAMALDKERISNRLAESNDNPLRMVLIEELPFGIFLGRMRSLSESRSLRAGGMYLWKLSYTGVPDRYFPAVVILFTVVAWFHAGYLKKQGLTIRCTKCGRPFCNRCMPGAGKNSICPQCQHIFIVKEGVESAMRVEKMMEVKSYQNRKRRLGFSLSAVLPGGGHVYLGYPILGILLALLTTVFLMMIAGWEGPLIDRHWLVFPWSGFFTRAGVVFLISVYVINLATIFKISQRER